MKVKTIIQLAAVAVAFPTAVAAQTVTKITTTEGNEWVQSKVKMQKKANAGAQLTVDANAQGVAWRAWGTTFNERDWEALLMLTRDEQDEVLRNVFSPQGDLHFTRGRIAMNASDYGCSWYSCDEVQGDLELRYFNIDRDKSSVIPMIRAAQKYCPDLTCWASPWSPPSWMKITGDYPVVSSKYNKANPQIDYLLYGTVEGIDEDEMKFLGERNGKFPRKLATQDYFIQDPRYLQAYANYFCKFISAYKEQGIPIDMVIYQNEAYSYTPYPGCPWTAEGTIRFNRDYLSPTLRKQHPDVRLYLGTINSNRQDHVERVLSDEGLRKCIDGVAFQWEGREILPAIRKQYPDYHYICSENECGNGNMDWSGAERTFFLITDNAGQGCDEWYNWNFILTDRGTSVWGWDQNALIQVDSKTRKLRYTAEYYAVKHFSHYVTPGSQMVGYLPKTGDGVMAVVFRLDKGGYAVVAGNTSDSAQQLSVDIAGRNLSDSLLPHSMNTYIYR